MKGTSVNHYLYRLFDANDQLLYVGISKSAIHRLHQHLEQQPWGDQVASQRIERFPTRQAVEAAEKQAIEREAPIHNVIYNKAKRFTAASGQNPREVLKVNDVAALGLINGQCPIGQVEAVSAMHVRLRPKSFITGSYELPSIVCRLVDIQEMRFASFVGAHDSITGQPIVDDDHLGDFQTKWQQRHKDLMDLAYSENVMFTVDRKTAEECDDWAELVRVYDLRRDK